MEKFRKMIQEIAKRQVPVQTRWVVVVSVDKAAGTMTAKSLDTDLEYYDVQLGAGAILNMPKTGSKALIGIVENKPAATFMVMATEIEEAYWTAELMKLNGDQHGGLIIFQKLFDELDKEKARVDKLYDAISNSAVAPQDGGLVFQQNMVAVLAGAQPGTFDDQLINDKVKHG